MSIYAEYLFLENALIGYILLYLTAKLCALGAKTGRLILGSVLCGIYAFVIFLPMHPALLFISKLAASAIIIFAVFREMSIRRLIKYIGVFYGVTVMLAGVCFLIIYTGGAQGMIVGAGFYIQLRSYGSIIIGVLLGFAGLSAFWEYMRGKVVKTISKAKIAISINDITFQANGIVDTGNFLRDPISGKPVIIVSEKMIPGLSDEERQKRFRLIPCKSVGNDGTLLEGIRADHIMISAGNQIIEEKNPIIAFYDPVLFDGKEYEAIIHSSIMVKI